MDFPATSHTLDSGFAEFPLVLIEGPGHDGAGSSDDSYGRSHIFWAKASGGLADDEPLDPLDSDDGQAVALRGASYGQAARRADAIEAAPSTATIEEDAVRPAGAVVSLAIDRRRRIKETILAHRQPTKGRQVMCRAFLLETCILDMPRLAGVAVDPDPQTVGIADKDLRLPPVPRTQGLGRVNQSTRSSIADLFGLQQRIA